jgi:pyruvate dehydrogenase E2 component (dihydrolipoamide acetyltransferase)
MFQFTLPDIGEGIAESKIVKWMVKVGDHIDEDEALMEVQNDKMVVELPSPVTGTITNILVEEGTVAKVGDVIVEIELDGAKGKDKVNPFATKTQSTTHENKVVVDEKKATSVDTGSRSGKVNIDIRLLAIPSIRRYAREKGVDLCSVTPTGKNNRVTKQDIDMFISRESTVVVNETVQIIEQVNEPINVTASNQVKEAPISAQQGLERREKMSPTRKAIAKAMVKSKSTAPHVTVFDAVDVSKLIDHRKKFKERAAKKGIKLTYMPYIVKALVAILREYPALNSSIDESTDEIVYKNYFNIGIATSTDTGLFVPNIKDANMKSILTIAKEISEYGAKAQNGELRSQDMRNGSSTITNVGGIATNGVWSTPIINYPEVAILGIGRIEYQAVVNEEKELIAAPIMKLSFSFDHRVIDGATAQQAINDLKELIADPELLLVEG